MKEQDSDVIKERTDDCSGNQLYNSPITLQSFSTHRTGEDLEPFLDLLKKVERNNGLRVKKVKKFSRLIDSGYYETEERIEELVERLMDELL